jgi:uncharacterized protein YbaR (Trm112 family)
VTGRFEPDLSAVVCPKCRGELQVRRDSDGAEAWLDCHACRRGYPVKDGIPAMLREESQLLKDGDGG